MRAFLLAVLATLVLPATAGATQARVSESCPRIEGACVSILSVVAGAGEVNAVEVVRASGAIEVTDRGAPLSAGAGCTARGANAVRCRADTVFLGLGDGNDSAALRGRPHPDDGARGGDGDDRLTGFPLAAGDAGADVVTGSAGPDALSGGAGPDRLSGLAGDDQLSGDGTQPSHVPGDAEIAGDVLDGGEGADEAVYNRTTAVRVDLADPGSDGGPGEDDRLSGIEGVQGGSAADVLLGDDGPNRISGGFGDQLDCRGGRDLVEAGGALLTGCERVSLPRTTVRSTPASARDGRLTFRLPCGKPLRPSGRRGRCRVVFASTQPDGRRTVVRRQLRPGGGRVTVPVGDPAAPLQLSLRYPGRFGAFVAAAWALPDGGRGGG